MEPPPTRSIQLTPPFSDDRTSQLQPQIDCALQNLDELPEQQSLNELQEQQANPANNCITID